MAAADIQHLTIDTITEEPNGESITVGWSTSRARATAIHTYRVAVAHQPIPRVYAQFGDDYYELCGRCGGAGNVGYGPDQGICYNCNGTGTHGGVMNITDLTAKLHRWTERSAAASRKQDRDIAARLAERQEWIAAHAELVAWAQALTPSQVDKDVDSYINEADTEAACQVGQGRFQERPLWTTQYKDGRWGTAFVYDEERFLQFGDKPDNMIRRVRAGYDLDRRETAYLTKVMASAKAELAANPAAAASRHAGPVGERLAISGIVTTVREMNDGEYLLIKVEGQGDHTGITFVTFSGGQAARDRKEGELVTVKGTIQSHDVFRGVKSDKVNRAAFTPLAELPTPAPAAPVQEPTPAPAAPAPAKATSAPVQPRKKAAGTRRREALGASVVDGWELLYDKPRAGAEVVRKDGRYAVACKEHATLHHLDRLSDEGKVRKAGGWCTEC